MKLTTRIDLLNHKYLTVQYRSPRELKLIWYTSVKNPRSNKKKKFAHSIYHDLAVKPPPSR